MARTYAIKRLLEHGPLTYGELSEITGWKKQPVDRCLREMTEQNLLTIRNINGHRHYELQS